MSVPGYQEFMLPLLKIAGDSQEHAVVDAMDTIATQMGISKEDRDALLPSGAQSRFYKVRLIDGDELAELMIDFNVGVSAADTYVVKKVDGDFFEAVG